MYLWYPEALKKLLNMSGDDTMKSERKIRPEHADEPSSESSTATNLEKDKFIKTINMEGFKLEEIEVKIEKQLYISVTGKRKQSAEHNKHSWTVENVFSVPDNVDLKRVKAHLGADGMLTISAPFKLPEDVIDKDKPGKIKDDTSIEMQKPKWEPATLTYISVWMLLVVLIGVALGRSFFTDDKLATSPST